MTAHEKEAGNNLLRYSDLRPFLPQPEFEF